MKRLKRVAIEMAKAGYLAFYTNRFVSRRIVNQFTRLYYHTPVPQRTWHTTFWLGTRVLKCPLDLWNYQEIVCELKPSLVIETGTADGGSALFFASVFDLLGHGRVVTIDVRETEHCPRHDRIEYLTGSSVDPQIVSRVAEKVDGRGPVIVVLDSDHRREHVLNELNLYSGFVTPGSYLIVEDTSVNGHPIGPFYGPGPMEAVREWIVGRDDFVITDRDEKFLMSFNPRGYLQRRTIPS